MWVTRPRGTTARDKSPLVCKARGMLLRRVLWVDTVELVWVTILTCQGGTAQPGLHVHHPNDTRDMLRRVLWVDTLELMWVTILAHNVGTPQRKFEVHSQATTSSLLQGAVGGHRGAGVGDHPGALWPAAARARRRACARRAR